jgi:hypothetical protein
MNKIKNRDFDPNFTSCPNQYSSPANDLLNAKRALASPFYGPNPDGRDFDKAADMWTKKAAMRMDIIINEANGE